MENLVFAKNEEFKISIRKFLLTTKLCVKNPRVKLLPPTTKRTLPTT